ncbi:hypothetical protein CHS0354_031439 [Potamilus streckersoni]|uniref:Uncharacterized protein n=1 Tax=Potamilus streckersoni TaxID=2493646 RepID=A0AAE0SH51_9BIVA|nr:hypothetical protein CHS0354_031439 [Potamilus streckersoni]
MDAPPSVVVTTSTALVMGTVFETVLTAVITGTTVEKIPDATVVTEAVVETLGGKVDTPDSDVAGLKYVVIGRAGVDIPDSSVDTFISGVADVSTVLMGEVVESGKAMVDSPGALVTAVTAVMTGAEVDIPGENVDTPGVNGTAVVMGTVVETTGANVAELTNVVTRTAWVESPGDGVDTADANVVAVAVVPIRIAVENPGTRVITLGSVDTAFKDVATSTTVDTPTGSSVESHGAKVDTPADGVAMLTTVATGTAEVEIPGASVDTPGTVVGAVADVLMGAAVDISDACVDAPCHEDSTVTAALDTPGASVNIPDAAVIYLW